VTTKSAAPAFKLARGFFEGDEFVFDCGFAFGLAAFEFG
jgi:hypothetical protein